MLSNESLISLISTILIFLIIIVVFIVLILYRLRKIKPKKEKESIRTGEEKAYLLVFVFFIIGYYSINFNSREIETQEEISAYLDISSFIEIKRYYDMNDYDISFITKSKSYIYAGAKEKSFFSFGIDERYDKFTLDGRYIKTIKWKSIPKTAIADYDKVMGILVDNSW